MYPSNKTAGARAYKILTDGKTRLTETYSRIRMTEVRVVQAIAPAAIALIMGGNSLRDPGVASRKKAVAPVADASRALKTYLDLTRLSGCLVP